MLAAAIAVPATLLLGWAARRFGWGRTRETGRKRIALFLVLLALTDGALGAVASIRHAQLAGWASAEPARAVAQFDAAPPGSIVVLAGRVAKKNEVLANDRVLEVECDEKTGACIERLTERFAVALEGGDVVAEGRDYERQNWPVEKWMDASKQFVALDQPVIVAGERSGTERLVAADAVFVGEHGDFRAATTTHRRVAMAARIASFGGAIVLLVGAALAFFLRRRGLTTDADAPVLPQDAP